MLAAPTWTPPKLHVKLTELTEQDQLAVRIGPTGRGTGELLVDILPTPVFEVQVITDPPTGSPTRR